MATRRQRSKPLNVAIQRIALLRDYPDSECSAHRGSLRWKGTLVPTPLSRSYVVEMTYQPPKPPRIFVVDPPLERRNGRLPPHRYREGNLCLYLPTANEWGSHKSLADTIVPWASEWLMHYELWLIDGKWHGGGVHPGGAADTSGKPRQAA